MDDEDFISITVDGVVVKVDSIFTHLFDRFTWRYARKTRMSYIVSSTTAHGKRVHMLLHRMVIGAKPGEVCDHINGDTLDNRRCNLRIVTTRENNLNAAKKPSKHGNRFRGISTRTYGFASQIRIDGRIACLGTFMTDVEAAYAYDVASLTHHGEYGRRNFLPLVK